MPTSLILVLERLHGIQYNKSYEIMDGGFFPGCNPYQITPPDSVTERKAAALCVRYQSDGWWLLNLSEDIHCQVNEVVLLHNHQIRIADGDTIQWGLSIWWVGDIISDVNEAENDVTAPMSYVPVPINVQMLDLDWFKTGSAVKENVHKQSPFDLIMTERHFESEVSIDSIDNCDVLHQLHQEYNLAITTQSLRQNDAEYIQEADEHLPSSMHQINELTDLDNTKDMRSLQEIVTGVLPIDQIFSGLDDLREAELFITEDTPELLHLFATTGHKENPSKSTSIPSITQKEHQSKGLDSPF